MTVSHPVVVRLYPILGYESSALYSGRVDERFVKTLEDHLHALLRSIRLEAGLRQSDLAARLGRPQSFVSKYESGERRLDLVELRAVCQAMGISLEEFVQKFERSLSHGR